jgi:hypothetical protein
VNATGTSFTLLPPAEEVNTKHPPGRNHSVTGGEGGETEERDSHAEAAGIAEKARRRTICSGDPGDTGSPERAPQAGFGESVSLSRHLPRFEDYRDLRLAGGNKPSLRTR